MLRERWHLAYPQVFEYQGKMYMVPDTMGRLALYEAEDFPFKWRQISKLFTYRMVDATIFFYRGTWWMTGNYDNYGLFFLHVYYAESPLGPWKANPYNCFERIDGKRFKCADPKGSQPHKHGDVRTLTEIRNGGKSFTYKGSAYRVVQHTKHAYGDSMDVYNMTTLSKTDMLQEIRVDVFRKNLRSYGSVQEWNSFRYHHMDLHRTKGIDGSPMFVAVVDGDRVGHHVEEDVTVVKSDC